jgi:hypothetical protein
MSNRSGKEEADTNIGVEELQLLIPIFASNFCFQFLIAFFRRTVKTSEKKLFISVFVYKKKQPEKLCFFAF